MKRAGMNPGPDKTIRSSNEITPLAPEPIESLNSDAFRFRTYRKIFSGNFNFVLWMLLCVPGIAFIILYYAEEDNGIWLLYAGIGCIATFLLRWMVNSFQQLSTYSEYKNFPSMLGFKLFGWEKLGSYPKQLSYRHWSHKSFIEVKTFDSYNEEQTQRVKQALKDFTVRANKHFYEAEMGGDGRKNWEIVGKMKVMGSSDNTVTGEIYTLINTKLRNIQKVYPVIESVKVHFDDNIFKVEPPRNTD